MTLTSAKTIMELSNHVKRGNKMPLVEAKCPNCGAKLSVDSEKDAAAVSFAEHRI